MISRRARQQEVLRDAVVRDERDCGMTGPAAFDPCEIRVAPVASLDLVYAPRPWVFAQERRADIAAHFEDLRRRTPELWNGQVLLQHRSGIEGDVFRGAYLKTDFASFIAWRDWDFPEA